MTVFLRPSRKPATAPITAEQSVTTRTVPRTCGERGLGVKGERLGTTWRNRRPRPSSQPGLRAASVGRSEAYADLDHNGPATEQARRDGRPGDDDDELGTTPLPAIGGHEPRLPVPPGQLLIAVARLPSRIRRGRPLRLLIRASVAAGACLAVLALIRGQPAAPPTWPA
jgi:hypothetical protein